MKSDKIKNWPVKERPRERLIAEGAERLTDAELLAIILRVGRGTFTEGVLGQNATDFAKELLTEFKGLRGLDRAHTEDLRKVPGLGTAKVSQIKAAIELGKRIQSKRLTAISFGTSSDVAAHFRPRFTGKRQEVVIAVFLNGQNQSLVINCPIGRQQINALSRQIIGQANINSVELRGLQIPLPPLAVQKQMMERVAAGREEIARERETADRLNREINAEIEALILGTKTLREA